MNPLHGIGIGAKLGGAFAAVLLLLATVIGFALLQIELLQERTETLVAGGLRKAVLAHAAQNAAQSGAARLHSLFLLEKRDARVPVYTEIDRDHAALGAALAALKTAAADEEERAVLRRVALARRQFDEAFGETVDSVELDIDIAKQHMLEETMPALKAMLSTVDELVALQVRRVESETAASRATQVRSARWMILLGLAAVLGGCLSAWAITRSIARPLAGAVRLADSIAAGRLDESLPSAGGDEIGTLIGALNRMRTGIATREERITTLAYWDALTGLPNRMLFNDRLHQSIKTASRAGHAVSVLIMDLDRFKHVNDILGHHVGDELLGQVAARLQEAMQRKSDTVARLGGDEFAVLLPMQDSREAMSVAQRLLSALEAPMTVAGQSIDVGASIGIASCPEHGEEAGQLLSRADVAMYIAKRSNSGATVFDARFDRDRQGSLSLMSELRRAVEHDELVLAFQPKVGLASDLPRQVEALVRWKHPERGFVPPDQFIPFAEQTGYIKAITRWVIERACAQNMRWRSAGLDIGVSINISARDLIHQDLPRIFAEALERYALPPERVSLEITESAVMDDPVVALQALERLHAMRLQLSIDDFGTGYSSLSYLKRLPVQELKIDKSFVMGMASDPDDAVIVRSTVDLGHNMGLKLVAEGIENQEIWDLLKALGCDYGQGYFVSRPLWPDELERWYARQPALV